MKKKHKKQIIKRSYKKKKLSKKTNILIKNKSKKENRIILSIIVIILFLIAIRIIKIYGSPNAELEKDAEKLLNAITTGKLKILNENQVDEKAVEEIMKEDYMKLKAKLGLKNEFCIHFENNNGELIKINGLQASIGSSKVKINGVSCG